MAEGAPAAHNSAIASGAAFGGGGGSGDFTGIQHFFGRYGNYVPPVSPQSAFSGFLKPPGLSGLNLSPLGFKGKPVRATDTGVFNAKGGSLGGGMSIGE